MATTVKSFEERMESFMDSIRDLKFEIIDVRARLGAALQAIHWLIGATCVLFFVTLYLLMKVTYISGRIEIKYQ